MTLQVNVNGTWKDASSVQVNVGGTWKDATSISTKSGGGWSLGYSLSLGAYSLGDLINDWNTKFTSFPISDLGTANPTYIQNRLISWNGTTSTTWSEATPILVVNYDYSQVYHMFGSDDPSYPYPWAGDPTSLGQSAYPSSGPVAIWHVTADPFGAGFDILPVEAQYV